MTQSTSLIVILCLTTLPAIYAKCDATNCTQTCISNDKTCPIFNCDKATQYCKQYCIDSTVTCNTLSCSEKQSSCKQVCTKCPKTTKLTCSSPTCEQSCGGNNCSMECTKAVKVCKQTCSKNSVCRMICHSGTQCERSCSDSSSCTYPASQPPTPSPVTSKCNQGNCEVSCEKSCRDQTLSCNGTDVKTCGLMCKDGCSMKCEALEKCTMNCTGDITHCKTSCKAKSCIVYHNGKLIKPVSAAKILLHNPILYGILVILLLFTAHW